MRDRVKKAAAIIEKGFGRLGKEDLGKMGVFDRLIWTVMSYGVEICGWKEKKGMEKVEERYLR